MEYYTFVRENFKTKKQTTFLYCFKLSRRIKLSKSTTSYILIGSRELGDRKT